MKVTFVIKSNMVLNLIRIFSETQLQSRIKLDFLHQSITNALGKLDIWSIENDWVKELSSNIGDP